LNSLKCKRLSHGPHLDRIEVIGTAAANFHDAHHNELWLGTGLGIGVGISSSTFFNGGIFLSTPSNSNWFPSSGAFDNDHELMGGIDNAVE
jgi:hypothetical protein